jgi:hypothetical protein
MAQNTYLYIAAAGLVIWTLIVIARTPRLGYDIFVALPANLAAVLVATAIFHDVIQRYFGTPAGLKPIQNGPPEMAYDWNTLCSLVLLYGTLAGQIAYVWSRRAVMKWRLQQRVYMSGRNYVDILFKQMGQRLLIEFFASAVGMALGWCGGFLAGFYCLFSGAPTNNRRERTSAAAATESD